MKSAVIGFPRVGANREFKFATEKYLKNEITEKELLRVSEKLKKEQWIMQKIAGIDYISSNDFSFYDGMLDTAVMLGAVPERYRELKLKHLDTYFSMARGYQGRYGDVKAFAMKKWFNTNYHYIVPQLYDNTKLRLAEQNYLKEYKLAKEIGVETKPVLIGGFTFLKLADYKETKQLEDYIDDIIQVYTEILHDCNQKGVQWLQIDEPILVTDLSPVDIAHFQKIYSEVLKGKGNVKILLQTYFGDVRDCYEEIIASDFDGIGLDFIEGKKTSKLLHKYGFPSEKVLFAGIINGKNIWKSNYNEKLTLLTDIHKISKNIVINSSCSFLHVPYTLENESGMNPQIAVKLSFAKEKLKELLEISVLADVSNYQDYVPYMVNQESISSVIVSKNIDVQKAVSELKEEDFIRGVSRDRRKKIQKEVLKLPVLPTTTIGSFPQTIEVKKNRTNLRRGTITKAEYDENVKKLIKDCITLQEEIGIDVLVHGEFERNDMVEFFGENLEGYVFTEKAWVQSYGTRCVKPPIIFGDVRRAKPITLFYSEYANSLTSKNVKGMLTGPVTILNWSFPREDISLKESAYQIALAIREEVLDLEGAGIRIIQIDEAALKEKLPLRKEEWSSEYLDWAVNAFRLCHSKVKPETQIHTHMCYSEFEDIIEDIDNLDADVISFEASRSDLKIIDSLMQHNFQTQVGPGLYDIHSPRIPSVNELEKVLKTIFTKVDIENLWVNPDCGLKTRGEGEAKESLINLVEATKNIRAMYIS